MSLTRAPEERRASIVASPSPKPVGSGQRLAGFGAWSLVGRVAPFLASMGTAVMIARLLPSHDVGAYTVLASLVYVGALVGSCGLSQVVVRFSSAGLVTGTPGQVRAAVRRCAVLGIGGAVVCGTGYVLAGRVAFHSLIGSTAAAVPAVLVGCWIVVGATQTLLAEALRGMGDARGAALFGGILSSAIVLAVVLAVAARHSRLGLEGLVVTVLVATATTVCAAGGVLAARLRALRRREAPLVVGPTTGSASQGGVEPTVRRLIATALPLLAASVLLAVLTQCDLWALARYESGAGVGIYALASRTASLAGYPVLIVNSALLPVAAELHARRDMPELRRLARLSAAVATVPTVVAGLVFALGGGWLLGLVYGPGYRSGAATLALLSAGNVVAAWTGPCGIILAMCGRERLFLALTAAVTTVTVTAMIILVPATGPLGAAAVAACGFAVLNIALMLAARRTEGIWTCVGIRSVCPRVRRSAGRHRAKAPVRTGGALE